MSVEDTLLDHLRALAELPCWKLSELPEQVTDKVLRCLDNRGWIELQVWKLRQRGGPTKVTGTFSPSRSPLCDGNWDQVLRKYRHGEGKRPEMYCELRVSEKGRARLAEADLSPPIQTPGDQGAEPARPKTWQPPQGYIGRKTVCNDKHFQKKGKNPPATTIDVWTKAAEREGWTVTHVRDRLGEKCPDDPCGRLGQRELIILYAPDSGECFYPERWIMDRIGIWYPRKPKT